MGLRVLVVAVVLFASKAAVSAPVQDDAIFAELDRRFGTTGPVPSPRGDALTARATRLRDFVRDRMAQDAFYDTLLPSLFYGLSSLGHPVVPLTLSRSGQGAEAFYFLDKPCAPSERVRVSAWWDPTHPVSICRDDYRPDLLADTRLGNERHCEYAYFGAVDASPRECRCGALLLSCARDVEQAHALERAYREEPLRTMQWVIQHHRPFSEVLTSNATVRSGLGEFFYARNRYYQSGTFRMPPLDEPATLRDRDPYFDGGIVATPHYVYSNDTHRATAALVAQDYLCLEKKSTSVNADQMFSVAAPSLRNFDHLELTTQIGCRDCHARLEYFTLAFRPWANVRVGQRVTPADAFAGTTRLYARDATDLRAEGPATLGWLGATMAAQPEFAGCVSDKVAQLVFQGLPPSEPVHGALVEWMRSTQDFAGLVERAVVARYLGAAALEALR